VKPHSLRLTAFGPFAGTVDVDIDALAEAGLFLLHGPTGAGKTTLLDGLGYALFGRVPGARNDAKRLRSDHAVEGVRTEVVLEVSFGVRRFRITRSPDYERAKLRGTGTTTEKAKVLLEEQVAGEWTFRSDRFDEAGQEIADLVGMSAEQFFQVVLLPQGEFARFLQATSKERAEVLQRLFATDRFADVEAWLAQRRRSTAEAVGDGRDEVEQLLARVAEVASAEVPETDPLPWAEHLLVEAQLAEAGAGEQVGHATAVRDTARTALDGVVALAQRQARRTAALGKQELLEARRPVLRALQQEADAATRAAEVAPVLAQATQRRAARDAALAAEAVARAALPAVGLDAGLGAHALRDSAAKARGHEGQLEALRATAQAEQSDRATARAAEAERLQALTVLTDLAVLLDELPRRQEQAAARVARGTEALQRRPQVQAQRERLEALRPDVVLLAQVQDRLVSLTEERLAARETLVSLQEKANDLRTASINSMIAKLAFALQHETPCPVCGSLDHPDPSELRDEGVSADDEQAARDAADAAALVVADVEQRLAAAEATAAALGERVGVLTLAAVDAQLAELDLDLSVLEAAAADGERAQSEVDDCARRLTAAATDQVAAEQQAAAAERRAAEADARAAAAHQRLAVALGEHADLDAALAAAAVVIECAESALAAAEQLLGAQQELDQALAAAEKASTAKGFHDLDEALAASRDPEWREQAALQLREAADVAAAVSAELADPAFDVALEPKAPVAGQEHLLAQADAALAETVAAHARLASRRTSLERLLPELVESLSRLRPLEERAREARQLADLCAGGGANGLKMTLSSFVLAARLEEVAEAASVRLLRMTQGRYALVHTDGAARSGLRAGLGLLARDAWSGQDRDTATLSGGETFLASLALALGLADVVTAEAGGGRIEALFVDEGFGTLDEETLDEVMDVLDALREGGRVVGLVSHVAELRQRIPAQVEVLKTRTGSDLVLHGC